METGWIFSIVAILLAALWAGFMVYKQNHHVREALYALALRAEKAWNKGEFGPIPKAALLSIVINQMLRVVIPKMPSWAQMYFTAPRLTMMFQTLYGGAMDYLDNGKFDGSWRSDQDGVASVVPEQKT